MMAICAFCRRRLIYRPVGAGDQPDIYYRKLAVIWNETVTGRQHGLYNRVPPLFNVGNTIADIGRQ